MESPGEFSSGGRARPSGRPNFLAGEVEADPEKSGSLGGTRPPFGEASLGGGGLYAGI